MSSDVDGSRTTPMSSDQGQQLQHLTQSEVAARWRLSPRTLERWRTQGVGPRWLRLHGRVLYRCEDIEAHEAARLRGSGD